MTPEREEALRRDSQVNSALGTMLAEVFDALDDERIANAEQRCCECGNKATSAVGTQLKMWLVQAFDEAVGVLTHAYECAAWVKVPGTTSTRRIDQDSPPCDCWIGKAKRYIRYDVTDRSVAVLQHVTAEHAAEWHDGEGWYWWEEEYPEGSHGAFATREEALRSIHASECVLLDEKPKGEQ